MNVHPRRLIGRLKTWNDDRGFGFIEPQGGGADVFVHIKAFPREAGRPQTDQVLSFETEQDNRGRLRATRVQLPRATRPAESNRAAPRPGHSRAPGSATPMDRFMRKLAPLMVVVAIVVAYDGVTNGRWRSGAAQHEPVEAVESDEFAQSGPSSPDAYRAAGTGRYRCDGRTHCPEMKSCAEATYFLRNCPGVEMDGDGDGVPCEGQWCGN